MSRTTRRYDVVERGVEPARRHEARRNAVRRTDLVQHGRAGSDKTGLSKENVAS